jgi:hypothetical protein
MNVKVSVERKRSPYGYIKDFLLGVHGFEFEEYMRGTAKRIQGVFSSRKFLALPNVARSFVFVN